MERSESRYIDANDEPKISAIIRDIVLFFVFIVASLMYGCPHYNVWQQGLAGEAELRRAQQNRQIAVTVAEAKKESAKALADAEVLRAQGVAQANKIIGDSLHNNESYLRYLWISELSSGHNSVIYVPTEANLPILEAGKRPVPPVAPAK